jgi:hypothetical protein
MISATVSSDTCQPAARSSSVTAGCRWMARLADRFRQPHATHRLPTHAAAERDLRSLKCREVPSNHGGWVRCSGGLLRQARSLLVSRRIPFTMSSSIAVSKYRVSLTDARLCHRQLATTLPWKACTRLSHGRPRDRSHLSDSLLSLPAGHPDLTSSIFQTGIEKSLDSKTGAPQVAPRM